MGALSKLIFGGDTYTDYNGRKEVTAEPATLEVGMTAADLSKMHLGDGGAIIIAAWISHKDKGALSSLNLSENCMASKEAGTALADAVKANSTLKQLDVSDNLVKGRWGRATGGDGPGFMQKLAVGIKDMRVLSCLNLARNDLSAEAFMGPTELYVGEKLVTTAVADWVSPLHRSLPIDRLEVVSAVPPLADGDITNVAEMLGKFVMVSRGGCSFVDKAQRLQAAGAIAMVCVNNDSVKPDEVPLMGDHGQREIAASITIPVVMVSFNTGAQIKALAEMVITTRKSLSLSDALKNHK
jgi:hypothetical protein